MLVATPLWKATIINALNERDEAQQRCFTDIFREYSHAKDQVIRLSEETVILQSEVTCIRQEKNGLAAKLENASTGKCYDYEEKLFSLQHEVTELHRQKGALAQDVIEINKCMQEKERSLQAKTSRIAELEELVKNLQHLHLQSVEKIKELEQSRSVLLSEQTSTLRTLKAAEQVNRQLEDDNARLLQRVKALQGTVEQLKNIEHDFEYRIKQEGIRRDLLDAASSAVLPPKIHEKEADIKYGALVPRKAIAKIDANEGDVNCVKFSPSGNLFASGGFDRKLRLWSFVNGKCDIHATLVGSNAAITAIDFDPEETVVLGASSDFSCRVWTLEDSRLRVNLTGHSERVVSAKFMGSSKKAATASSDRTLKLWDVDKCCCKRTYMAGSAFIDVVACSQLNLVITGHFDGHLRMWDERTAETTGQLALSGRITGLDLSPDGILVLACTRDNRLDVVDLRHGEVIQRFQSEEFHVGLDTVRPCFSPDCQYVAAGGQDGGVYIWNTASGALQTCLREHSNVVVCCHWHPKGYAIVSCERVKKAILWADY